ncbi:hypothetical protein [Solicola gregarius]|uniref:Uncharacterized protein n=1 Tax=Solicola gregarius TaxID=2908642 RepID=A0AA46TDZ7_9ACTN|nr:hypothetical protein [Solicola gregarius]UYM03556.1 hypothetical protein L0C25_13415 [Solicola gregarius]
MPEERGNGYARLVPAQVSLGVLQDGSHTEGRRGLDDRARVLEEQLYARDDRLLAYQHGVVGRDRGAS